MTPRQLAPAVLLVVAISLSPASGLAEDDGSPGTRNVPPCVGYDPVKIERDRWQLMLEKRVQRLRGRFDDARTVLKGQADLRSDRQTDLVAKEAFVEAQISYRIAMAKKLPEMHKARMQQQAAQNDLRRQQTEHVLDRSRGGIAWPLLLKVDERFARQRGEIDAIFAETSCYTPELTDLEYLRIANLTDQMSATLKTLIREVKPQHYGQSTRFLDDLKVQANSLVVSRCVADATEPADAEATQLSSQAAVADRTESPKLRPSEY